MPAPDDGVALGAPTLVTFGMPFPRGSITSAGLATLRITRNGAEIPAFVEQLTPWRHRHNAAFDGTSVRIARVQNRHSFAAGYPASEGITVSWGRHAALHGAIVQRGDCGIFADPARREHAQRNDRAVAGNGGGSMSVSPH